MGALKKSAAASLENEIQQWLNGHIAALKAKDVDRVMLNYAPDAVIYDCMPPLVQDILELRTNYTMFFEYSKEITTYDYRDLHVMAKDHFAYCHFLCHIAFEFKDGHQHNGQKRIDNWMRSSLGLCQIDGSWKIIHEHVSAPIDMETGKGLMDLKP